MEIPFESAKSIPNHKFEDKKYGYSRYIVRADGTGTAYLKLSNGSHNGSGLKAGISINFYDAAGIRKLGIVLNAEVSGLFPGAKTKEKDVSQNFMLTLEEWESVDKVAHAYFVGYSIQELLSPDKPDMFDGLKDGVWTIGTF